MSDITETPQVSIPDLGNEEKVTPPSFFDAHDEKSNGAPGSITMLMDVNLQVTVELGNTEMSVRQVLDLQKGSVVELNRIAGDSVDVFVNNHLIARGEVVVVDDKFGVRITELVSSTSETGEA
jgi:flagellar motor switch protein FliN